MAIEKPDWFDDQDFVEKWQSLYERIQDDTWSVLCDEHGMSEDRAEPFAQATFHMITTMMGWSGPTVESPIEALMYAALFPYMLRGEVTPLIQREYGNYRVDFVLVGNSGENIIVEVDGHDYHERTKDQAERDKRRDRWFASRNRRVVRFTGREVWRNPDGCAKEAMDLLYGTGAE